MDTYAIVRRRGWRTPDELHEAAERSRAVGNEEMPDKVRWIRTYTLEEDDGTLGAVCIYQATDLDAIREHSTRAQLPDPEIVPIDDTIVVRPDPEGVKV